MHSGFVDSKITSLLILQDRDVNKITIENRLKSLPVELAAIRDKSAEIYSERALEEQVLKTLEVERSSLDSQVSAAQDKIRKYKNQQLEVKKNEEYQALNAEIANMESSVDELEEAEIALMLKIDEEKAAFAQHEAERSERIALLDTEMANLTQYQDQLTQELTTATAAAEAAAADVDAHYLNSYTNAKSRKIKPPFVAPLDEQRCKGCHLKVSGEVETRARRFAEFDEPVHCDSCGRVVYWQ